MVLFDCSALVVAIKRMLQPAKSERNVAKSKGEQTRLRDK